MRGATDNGSAHTGGSLWRRKETRGVSLPSILASEPQSQAGGPGAWRARALGRFHLGTFFLLTFSFSFQGKLVTKDYPTYALAVIGLLVAASTMCIPLVALGTFVMSRLKKGDTAPVA